ncbi:hypothetical protein SOVF_143380 [Spinacia oleracea]|nr:hypothetical protein SOVF_143380 [Spinacia oleracea]
MEQKDEDPPPFWMQNTTALRRADRHRHRRNQLASSLFLNTGVLVVLLLAAAVVFLAIVIPSVLSLARSIFNPSLVKSSWNSLNLILVLFAIVCGFLGRKDDDQSTPVSSPMKQEAVKSVESSSPRQWYEYQDSMRRLRRNISSYPDLRQEGQWLVSENRWRSYDDTHVYNHQFQRSESRISRSRSMGVLDEDEIDVKNIGVDTFVGGGIEVAPPSRTPSPPTPPPPAASHNNVHVRSKQVADEDEDQYVTKNIEMVTKSESIPPSVHQSIPPSPPLSPLSPISPTSYFWPSPSPLPPPPPPPPQRAHSSMSVKKKHETKKKHENNNPGKRESRSKVPIQAPPPPPPPPPPQSRPIRGQFSEDTRDKKRGIVVRTLSRLPRRKRKQARRSYENLTEIIQPPKTSIQRSKSTPEFPPASPPHPPPPPPPPPPSMFQNIFTKKGKGKRKVHSHFTTTSSPRHVPSPPARPQQHQYQSHRPSPKTTTTPPATRRTVPLPPAKTDSFSSMAGNNGNGSESPLIPIPPPPPPPPFKMSAWRFVTQGDYVKIESNNNSPCSFGFSASEDEDSSPNNQKSSNLFCPSPDVDTKADDFIAKFRARLKLDKMNSIKRNHGTGPSPLGSDSGQP